MALAPFLWSFAMFDFGERSRQIRFLREILSCDFSAEWDRDRMERCLSALRRLPDQLQAELDSTLEEVTLAELPPAELAGLAD